MAVHQFLFVNEKWCIDNNNVSNSEDEPFIVNYKTFYSDGSDVEQENDDVQYNSKFRIFISTKRLLCQASGKDKLHVDGTYKLNWQGFQINLFLYCRCLSSRSFMANIWVCYK